jgi:hypothetical protein
MGKTLRFAANKNHDLCVIDAISELIEAHYTCYLEYEIVINEKGRIKVDILAIRNTEKVIVEVGTLSNRHGERLEMLRLLEPKARIVHIRQWKNYGITESLLYMLHKDWERKI